MSTKLRVLTLVLVISFFNYCILTLRAALAQEIPSSPSEVFIDENNRMMVKRPQDDRPQPYVIMGVNWSAASLAPREGPNPKNPLESIPYGFFFDWDGRDPQGYEVLNYWLKNELAIPRNYQTDACWMKFLNVNTVRIYASLGASLESYQEVAQQLRPALDEFYRSGIMVILTVAEAKSDLDSQRYLEVVRAFGQHPAVLSWAIGNEWNINKFFADWSLAEASAAINLAAQRIKEIDPHHPVCSILADQFQLSAQGVWVIGDLLPLCPDVEVWGFNVYRGASFGNLFSQYNELWPTLGLPVRPFFFSEFGIDSFQTTNFILQSPNLADDVLGFEDQRTQAEFDARLWQEIKTHLSLRRLGELCLGGLVFEFNDEPWKVGNFHVGLRGLVDYDGTDDISDTSDDDQSYAAYNLEGFFLAGASPDNVQNEEHFGLVKADRTPKEAALRMREAFAPDVAVQGLKFLKPGSQQNARLLHGQAVVCRAIFKNRGMSFTGRFKVQWFLDGKEVLVQEHPGLVLGERGFLDYFWVSPSQSEHTLGFVVDAQNQIPEVTKENNFCIQTVAVNLPPIVRISASVSEGGSPLRVSFSAGQSFDPDGEIVSYFWRFGDGHRSTHPNPGHIFYNHSRKPRSYRVRLKVKDNRGAKTEEELGIMVYPLDRKVP